MKLYESLITSMNIMSKLSISAHREYRNGAIWIIILFAIKNCCVIQEWKNGYECNAES